MAMGGVGPSAMAAIWTLTAIVFAFLLLRLYTRIVCLSSYGIDDHVYFVAFIFLLVFTIFTQLAAEHGFGQYQADIGDMEEIVKANLYECIGQAFAITGMAIAKCSMGFFLLRLVTDMWHRVAIYVSMAFVTLASIAQVLAFWLACTPFAFVYDRRIPGGYCGFDTRPTSYILCVSTVLVDFFFAIFPWVFIWKLQMSTREKITIAGSMSLGVLAAAAGIKRTTEVEGLYGAEYLRDSVGLIVWSAAEMSVTMICVGVPVCLPLYLRWFQSLQSRGTSGYLKQENELPPPIGLYTIGGSAMPGGSSNASGSKGTSKHEEGERLRAQLQLGVSGPYSHAHVSSGINDGATTNDSDEEILGQEFRRSQQRDITTGADEARPNADGIQVTESYRVDRS